MSFVEEEEPFWAFSRGILLLELSLPVAELLPLVEVMEDELELSLEKELALLPKEAVLVLSLLGEFRKACWLLLEPGSTFCMVLVLVLEFGSLKKRSTFTLETSDESDDLEID